MLEAIGNIPWDSLATLSSPRILLLLLLGVTGGLAVGITPGLGPTIAVALLIPVTFTMPPDEAFAILTAVYVGGMSGGALTAILLRLPGTPASMATVLDGFPLAQRGEAGRAIGNAIIASFFGTIIGAIFLVLLAPLLARFALKFHFAEYAAVSIFALTSVAALTGSSTALGLLSAVLGMLLATVGLTQEDGLPRFTFDLTDLQAGFRLIPALIGLFAVSQLMKTSLFTRAESTPKLRLDPGGSYLPSARDILANKMNYIRSGIIGTFVGVIPALGGGPAALIAYAQARNASADRDQFGKGSIEGLIASETANNATIGGGLIIALTVGIPGDPTSAVLLGGLMIHGAQPGPATVWFHPRNTLRHLFLPLYQQHDDGGRALRRGPIHRSRGPDAALRPQSGIARHVYLRRVLAQQLRRRHMGHDWFRVSWVSYGVPSLSPAASRAGTDSGAVGGGERSETVGSRTESRSARHSASCSEFFGAVGGFPADGATAQALLTRAIPVCPWHVLDRLRPASLTPQALK